SSTGESCTLSLSAPNAAESMVATVTPICTADRKRLGSRASLATRSPRRPCWASLRTWLSRSETMAISAAAKKPPTRMNSRTTAMLAAMVSNMVVGSVYGPLPAYAEQQAVQNQTYPNGSQHEAAGHRRRGVRRQRRSGAARGGGPRRRRAGRPVHRPRGRGAGRRVVREGVDRRRRAGARRGRRGAALRGQVAGRRVGGEAGALLGEQPR